MKSFRNIFFIGVALMLMASPVNSYAQYQSIALGVKIAPNIGWLRADLENYSNEGIVTGIGWGLISDFYFAENYAFSTGFTVSFHNGKISYPDLQSDAIGVLNRSYRLKYIDIPLLIKMKTNDLGKFRFFGNIGIQPGVRIGSKAKDSFRSTIPPMTITKDWHAIDSQTNLFRATMVIGGGIEYPIDNSTAIIAGINFINGLSDVLKGDNRVNTAVEHKGVPNAFELTIGVIF
ncbi:MAG: PorT family protein [Lentimicrobium sp.]|nr:PorT family protein [Lentimicrobium sp.]